MRLKNHEVLGETGAYEILDLIDRNRYLTEPEIIAGMGTDLAPEAIKRLMDEMTSIALIRKVPSYEWLEMTDIGREAFLLVKVINGANLDSVLNQLSGLQANSYSLVTQNICGCFLDILKHRSGVEDVDICSPWVRLSDRSLSDLEAMFERNSWKVRFRVITRPPLELSEQGASFREESLGTLLWFKRHDAELIKLKELHTKLYCVTGRNWQTAIFGSENLTETENIELGIRVNDEPMTKKLLSYFDRIYRSGEEISEEDFNVRKKNRSY